MLERSRIGDAAESELKPKKSELVAFATAAEWRRWLTKNHQTADGVWLRFYKKDSGVPTVVYAEALDEALCFGWIDGQAQSLDAKSYCQRFTPRRARSIWSKRNIAHVARLIKTKKMRAAGLKQITAAKADGRWKQAYDSPSKAKVPPDFLRELNKNPKAKAFFATLNRANLYAITWRLQTAKKPETREKRKTEILAMLAAGKKFH